MENREAILSLAEAADQLPEETSFCLVGVVGNRVYFFGESLAIDTLKEILGHDQPSTAADATKSDPAENDGLASSPRLH